MHFFRLWNPVDASLFILQLSFPIIISFEFYVDSKSGRIFALRLIWGTLPPPLPFFLCPPPHKIYFSPPWNFKSLITPLLMRILIFYKNAILLQIKFYTCPNQNFHVVGGLWGTLKVAPFSAKTRVLLISTICNKNFLPMHSYNIEV